MNWSSAHIFFQNQFVCLFVVVFSKQNIPGISAECHAVWIESCPAFCGA